MQGFGKSALFANSEVFLTIRNMYINGYSVYIMASKKNGTLYTGMTGNLGVFQFY
jgi:hypothetical protein